MIRADDAMKLLTTVLLTLATVFAQSSDRLPVTDAEKMEQRIQQKLEPYAAQLALLDEIPAVSIGLWPR